MYVCISGGDICWAADVSGNGETYGNNLSKDAIHGAVYDDSKIFVSYEKGDLIPTKTSNYVTPQVSVWSRKTVLKIEGGNEIVLSTAASGAKPQDWAGALGLAKIVIGSSDGSEKDVSEFTKTADMATYLNDTYWKNPDYAEEISNALTSVNWKDEKVLDAIKNKLDFEKIKQDSGVGDSWDAEGIKTTLLTKIQSGVGGQMKFYSEPLERAIYEALKEAIPGFGEIDSSYLSNMPQIYGYDDRGNKVLLELNGLKFASTTVSVNNDVDNYYTYDNQSVGADTVWRPMDRLEETKSGIIDSNYTINQVFSVDKNGNLVLGPADGVTGTGQLDINPDFSNTTDATEYGEATTINVKDLDVATGGVVDLAYVNTKGSDPLVNHMLPQDGYPWTKYTGYYVYDSYENMYGEIAYKSRKLNRYLFADTANLADGAIFRLGLYGRKNNNDSNTVDITNNIWGIANDTNDAVYIGNAVAVNKNGTDPNKIYVQLGWVPGVGTEIAGVGKIEADAWNKGNNRPVVVGILEGAENFEVEGQKTIADGIFSDYEIDVKIDKDENYFTDPTDENNKKGTAWYISEYSFQDTGSVAESGKSAADNAMISNNLWKANYLNMFSRTSKLHRDGYLGEADEKENLWIQANHGKFKNASAYGRSVSQSYNGYSIGYDKLLGKGYWDGRSYVGFFVNKTDGNSNTLTGSGDQDSMGIGVYTTWVGDKGHYLDVGITAAKLKNDFNLQANQGNGATGRVSGDLSTWGYGIGAQYGYQKTYSNGLFWEPYVNLFLGHVDETEYKLSNNLGVKQKGYDTVTGKYGLNFGKMLGEKGSVYAGIAAVQEYGGNGQVIQHYGGRERSLDKHNGTDTYAEFTVGSNLKISPTGTVNLNFVKTAGSDVGSEWNINGGANWTWGGFYGRNKKGAVQKLASQAEIASDADVILESAGKFEDTAVYKKSGHTPTVVIGGNNAADLAAVYSAGEEAAAEVNFGGTLAEGNIEEGFVLPEVTVSSARPDWEKKLSPGQVTVIKTEEFQGEQKDLPELLERVPGLFVQRISGTGHYTVARVRGSTAAQVNVYVDGVLMNLNGESGVNLSTIPVDNVERVEVYRGYVPARFSGSPLGGVINIVTKKPTEMSGMVSQGMKSYGGYTGNYQLNMPLGSGSLLATYQRDIWKGDFGVDLYNNDKYVDTINRRSNDYQNNNGMLKWQDEHWMTKFSWKDMHEGIPRSLDRYVIGSGSSWNEGYIDDLHKGYYDAEQNINQKEFQIGRQDTVGNLDWGWRINYIDSKKDYRNLGRLKKAHEEGKDDERYYNEGAGERWSKYHSKKWDTNLNAALKMGDNHLLEFNGNFQYEKMDANGSFWDTGYYKADGNLHKLLTEYNNREYHFTLQDTITLNSDGDFKLTPIFRADKVEMETLGDADASWKWSGGAALQKNITDSLSFKTTWGTYNRHPNFYEIFGDGANMMPNDNAGTFFDIADRGTWESGTQFDFSLNWQGKMLKSDSDIILTWFQRKSKNQMALWAPLVPNAPMTYFPMDEGEVHGVEVGALFKWNRIDLNIAGTWQKAEYSGGKMGNIFNGMKSTISYTPEWVWNVRLNYLFPGDKLNVFAEYNYIDKQLVNYSGDNDISTANYLQQLSTLDLGLKYKFDKNWRLTAGVNDIFDAGHDQRLMNYGTVGSSGSTGYTHKCSTPTYPAAGRMYYTTVEYSF